MTPTLDTEEFCLWQECLDLGRFVVRNDGVCGTLSPDIVSRQLKAARSAQNTNAYMNEQEPLVGPCDGLECLVYAVQNIVRDTRRDDALEAA